jgi:hypothetical protein
MSSSDYRSHDRRVRRSCQLIALHHCRRPRSHLHGSPLRSHAELRPLHPPALSSPRSPAPLDSSLARAVPLWFPSSSPRPWCTFQVAAYELQMARHLVNRLLHSFQHVSLLAAPRSIIKRTEARRPSSLSVKPQSKHLSPSNFFDIHSTPCQRTTGMNPLISLSIQRKVSCTTWHWSLGTTGLLL